MLDDLGVRRRRRWRGFAIGTAGALLVGAIGMGAWGLAGSTRAADPQPGVSDSASAEPESTPSAASAPAGPDGRAVDDSADGIPEDGYPALASERSTIESIGFFLEYPQAHVMEDWVWDRVGPGWGMGSVSAPAHATVDGVAPPAVLYLRSPEGVYFEVAELPAQARDDARVVSWHEDQRYVRLRSGDGGGRIDLVTGDFEPLEFSIGGETAPHETFVAANAAGDELWFVEHDGGGGYYRWDAGGGWAKASLWEIAPEARSFGDPVGHTAPISSVDGDSVLLAVAESVDAVPTLLVHYRLSADESTPFEPGFPSDATSVYNVAWVEGDTVSFELGMPEGFRHALVEVGGHVRFAEAPARPEDQLADLPEWVDVEFGEATRRATAATVYGG